MEVFTSFTFVYGLCLPGHKFFFLRIKKSTPWQTISSNFFGILAVSNVSCMSDLFYFLSYLVWETRCPSQHLHFCDNHYLLVVFSCSIKSTLINSSMYWQKKGSETSNISSAFCTIVCSPMQYCKKRLKLITIFSQPSCHHLSIIGYKNYCISYNTIFEVQK